MKKLITIALMAVLSLTTVFAQEGKKIYNKYSGAEGVSAVYVSKAMFNLIGSLPDMDIEGENGEKIDIAPIMKSFEGLYIINTSNSSIKNGIAEDARAMVRKGNYEMLMEVKDGGETVNIYTIGDKNNISSFVFIANDSDETSFICIDGIIPRIDLVKLITAAQ